VFPGERDRSAVSAAHAVDLTSVALRRTTGATVTCAEQRLEAGLSFGRWWTAILEALDRERGTNSFRDEFGDVENPLALIDASLDEITQPHWCRWLSGGTVDPDVPSSTGRGSTLAGLGDPHRCQP
jgi:hypothetical protein